MKKLLSGKSKKWWGLLIVVVVVAAFALSNIFLNFESLPAAISLETKDLGRLGPPSAVEWLEGDKQILFTFEVKTGIDRVLYDVEKRQVVPKPNGLYPEISSDIMERITKNGRVNLQLHIVKSPVINTSPSGSKQVYFRWSDEAQAGLVDPRLETYDTDIWIAEDNAQSRTKLGIKACFLNRTPMVWRAQETIVLISCSYPYGGGGSTSYLVNLLQKTAREFGAIYADISFDGTQILFAGKRTNWDFEMWIAPVAALPNQQPEYKLNIEGRVLFAKWSHDGKWIYYWKRPFLSNGELGNHLVFERINVATQQVELLLNDAQLSQLMGEKYTTPSPYDPEQIEFDASTPIVWALSSDGRQIVSLGNRKIWLITLPIK